MNTQILQKVEQKYLKNDLPDFAAGDTISVYYKIMDDAGKNSRTQIFKGIVLAMKNSGLRKTFTIRKIGANSIGVERIIPLHSPLIEKITLDKKGKVRRSKIYYMRERGGRAAMKINDATQKPTVIETEK